MRPVLLFILFFCVDSAYRLAKLEAKLDAFAAEDEEIAVANMLKEKDTDTRTAADFAAMFEGYDSDE